jgi:hypothetical protein
MSKKQRGCSRVPLPPCQKVLPHSSVCCHAVQLVEHQYWNADSFVSLSGTDNAPEMLSSTLHWHCNQWDCTVEDGNIDITTVSIPLTLLGSWWICFRCGNQDGIIHLTAIPVQVHMLVLWFHQEPQYGTFIFLSLLACPLPLPPGCRCTVYISIKWWLCCMFTMLRFYAVIVSFI